MAVVVSSNGVLEYFDTFAALAEYEELHAADTVEPDTVEAAPSIVTLQLTNADADTIVNIDSDVVVVDASKRKRAINITGNDENNSIKGGSGADTLNGTKGNDTLTGGKGKDVFVYDGAGNDIITDYVSGTDKIKIYNATISSSEIDEDEGNLIFYFENAGSLTVNNVVKKGKPQKITVTDAKGVTSSQTYGVASISIANSDGSKINLEANNNVETASASNRTNTVHIIGNINDNVIKGGKGADTLEGGADTDDTLTGGGGADTFLYRGGDDVITDYNPKQNDVIKFTGTSYEGYSVEDNNVIFETSDGSITILNGKGKKITYIDSQDKYVKNTYNDVTEYIFSKTYKESSFSANASDRNAKSNIITINASQLSKGITITGNKQNNIIIGSKGNDSLFGVTGNDTFTGGAGKDTIVHENGNDVVTDYKAGEDVIKLRNRNLVDASISASAATDVVLTFDNKSTLTIKNAIKISKGKKTPQKITIADRNDKISHITYGRESISLNDTSEASFNAASKYNTTIVTVNASSRKKGVKITGNGNGNILKGGSGNDTIIAGAAASTLIGGSGNDLLNGSIESDSITGGKGHDEVYAFDGNDTVVAGEGDDTIYGGIGADILNGGKGNDVIYGDEGNDTLTGGAGSDTLYGGEGKDFFVYTAGDGNDVIADYEVDDIIKLGKKTTIKSASKEDTDYVLRIGKSELTIKDAADKNITILNSKGEEIIYNKERSYREIDSLWFDDVAIDSNSLVSNELDSILKNDSNILTDSENYSDVQQFDSSEKSLLNNIVYENVKKVDK